MTYDAVSVENIQLPPQLFFAKKQTIKAIGRVPRRLQCLLNQVETAVHGCHSWLLVWTLSCSCLVKLLRVMKDLRAHRVKGYFYATDSSSISQSPLFCKSTYPLHGLADPKALVPFHLLLGSTSCIPALEYSSDHHVTVICVMSLWSRVISAVRLSYRHAREFYLDYNRDFLLVLLIII